MSNWDSVNFSDFVPQPLTKSFSAISDVVSQFLTLYKEALQFTETYEKTFLNSDVDILGVLVQAIIDTLEGMLQAGKIHALFVPMRKQVPPSSGLVPNTLEAMSVNLGLSWEESAKILQSGANTNYQTLLARMGGNAGFYRTFVESLIDIFDPNRPQYLSSQDYVACTVLMAGAPSFVELIDIASAFNRVFRPSGNANLTARLIPVPRNLQVRVIALPKATKIGVRLDWGVPRPVYDSPYFPRIGMVVSQYAIIRSTDKKATSAKSVLDFFATQDLTAGLTSTDAAQSAKVIAIGTGTTSSYVDDDENLNIATTYYYCVAWRIQLSENGVDKTLPWDLVSNVQKTRVRVPPGTANSKPPDWQAYGSMLNLVPDLAVTVRIAIEQLRRIGDRNGGVQASLAAGAKALDANATAFGARLTDLNVRLQRLAAVFSTALPGIYHTSFAGQGGNFYLISELARRLNDTTDPNRPPYDASEYVIGVVLVAGGPRQPDIQPVIEFMQTLFATPNTSSALVGVINSIDNVVTAQEQQAFGPSLQPLPAGSTVDPTTGLPAIASYPVIANDGTPVASSDPKNPETGTTGRPDPAADPC